MLGGADLAGLIEWIEERFGRIAAWIIAVAIVVAFVGSIALIFRTG